MCFFTVNNIVAYNYNGMKNDGTFGLIISGISKTKPRVRHLINVKGPHFLHFVA